MVTITPKTVHETLRKLMLVDGFDIIVDLEKSKGTYIFDAREGRWYLDFFTFFATSPVGLNHPKMTTKEFKEKLARVAINKPSNSDVYTVEMAEFVETFRQLAVPPYLKYAFFIEGGALGVENALKASFDWKIRKNFAKGHKDEIGTQVIHFREAFHGRTGYTVSMTNTADPRKHMYFPKFKWPRVLNPKITFPLNDENLRQVQAAEQESLRQIREAIARDGDDIAALILEPIQGEGGDNHFRQEFFHALRKICDENNIMLIFDEVQTGLGLTGTMWAHQHFDVKPDFIAFGKKTQVCGMLAGPRIDEVENNVFHESTRINSTWGGNLVDMVRCQKYLEIIHEENLIENARVMGEYLLTGLLGIQKEFEGQMTNVRGRGLMIAFDLPEKAIRNDFLKVAFKNQIICLGCGERSVRFRPPLNLSQKEADEGLEKVRKSLAEVLRKKVTPEMDEKIQHRFEL